MNGEGVLHELILCYDFGFGVYDGCTAWSEVFPIDMSPTANDEVSGHQAKFEEDEFMTVWDGVSNFTTL